VALLFVEAAHEFDALCLCFGVVFSNLVH
jgi:hypothetical protein